jgi:RNA polymerase sigma-70 factor, ECF subfamily
LDKDREQLIMDWYEMYYEDIYRFILFMMGDTQCCEDLVHDTFVRAHTAYDRFQHQSNVKTWLFSIAKHLVIDEIRKRKRRRWFSAFVNEREIPSNFNLEQHTENKEMIMQLMTAIQQLKPHYRLVITLKKIEGYSTKEIAQILNWSEAKVRKTLSRAMQALRKMNGFEGGDHVEQTY